MISLLPGTVFIIEMEQVKAASAEATAFRLRNAIFDKVS